MMDRDFFMNAGIKPPQQFDTTMGMNFIGLNCPPEQAFMEPNSSADRYSKFQSAMMSSLASSTPGSSNDALALRELIGNLGVDGAENFNPQSSSTLYESCHSTPLSSPHKPHLPILDHANRGNLGYSVPLASLSADPGFAARAAKFSCFGSLSLNGRTAPIGLNTVELQSRSGSPLMGSGKLPRVASNPVLKQAGSPVPQIETSANNGISHSPGSEKKLSKLSGSGANSNEESSVSEQIPSGESRPNTSIELNYRKRKVVSRAKPKEDGSNSAKEGGDDEDVNAKRWKTQEESKEGSNEKPPEPFKDYIHVRARRGQATDSHSLAERVRREKIGDRMKLLQDLVPGCNKVSGKALMLNEIINYVKSLQCQVEFLSMKLASVNPELDNNLLTKYQNGNVPQELYSSDSSAAAAFYNHHQSHQNVQPSLDHVQLGIQFPSLDGVSASFPEFSIFGEDDLHSIVHMNFSDSSLKFPVLNQLSER